MARSISEQRYSLATAAGAAGASPKAIRNWIDKNQVPGLKADTGRQGVGWRRFSVSDILRLAFIKRLVNFGAPVEWAALQSGGVLIVAVRSIGWHAALQELADILAGSQVVVWRDRSYWVSKHLQFHEQADFHLPADAFLTVDVGRLVQSVISALSEAGE